MNIEWLLVDSHHSTEAVPPYTAVIWPADGAISIFISEVKKNVYYCLFLSDKQLHKQFNQIKHLYSSPVFQQDTVSSKHTPWRTLFDKNTSMLVHSYSALMFYFCLYWQHVVLREKEAPGQTKGDGGGEAAGWVEAHCKHLYNTAGRFKW